MVSWHEMLPNIGDFINKTGFPVGLWLITAFIVYKIGKKIFIKIEPIVDNYIELVKELKNNSGRTTEILEKQNEILTNNFMVHTNILNDHTAKLDAIMKLNFERNEILDESKNVLPLNGIMSSAAGVSNGIKR